MGTEPSFVCFLSNTLLWFGLVWFELKKAEAEMKLVRAAQMLVGTHSISLSISISISTRARTEAGAEARLSETMFERKSALDGSAEICLVG